MTSLFRWALAARRRSRARGTGARGAQRLRHRARMGRARRRSSAATRSRSTSATNALQDPHHVEAKPSLIARARSADLVVATGAELEIGWLPLVIQQAGNPAIQPGKPGYFEAAALRDAAREADAPRSRRGRRASAAAIRTSRPIRATSRAWRRRSRRASPSSIRRMPRTTRRATRRSPSAGARRSRNWEKQAAPLQRHADRRPAQGLHVPRGLARAERDRGARAEARRRADDGASVRSARDCCSGSRRRW